MTFEHYFHRLLPEMRDVEIIPKHLDPATRQAFSCPCKEYHLKWHDKRLVWRNPKRWDDNIVLDPYQLEYVEQGNIVYLKELLQNMPNGVFDTELINAMTRNRLLKEIEEIVSGMKAFESGCYCVLRAFIKSNRFDCLELFMEHCPSKFGWHHCHITAALTGNSAFLWRFYDKIVPNEELIYTLVGKNHNVDWVRLMAKSECLPILQSMTSQYILMRAIQIRRPEPLWTQLPHIWPYLTHTQKEWFRLEGLSLYYAPFDMSQ